MSGRPAWSVKARLVASTLVASVSAVSMAGLAVDRVDRMRGTVDVLFNDILATTHATSEMVEQTDDVHIAALAILVAARSKPPRSRPAWRTS